MAAACVAGRAKINTDDYPLYVKGIHDLHDHIFLENYSVEIAATSAPKIVYMVMCILTEITFEKDVDYTDYVKKQIINDDLKPLKYLKKIDTVAYAYTIKAELN